MTLSQQLNEAISEAKTPRWGERTEGEYATQVGRDGEPFHGAMKDPDNTIRIFVGPLSKDEADQWLKANGKQCVDKALDHANGVNKPQSFKVEGKSVYWKLG